MTTLTGVSLAEHGGDARSRATLAPPNLDSIPIVVHSHLRWDFVWQRPQQILSRLARNHPVLFLEEPMDSPDKSRLIISSIASGVVRAVPALTKDIAGTDERIAAVVRLLLDALNDQASPIRVFESAVHWFYSPMTAPAVLRCIEPAAVVYDCMDELANFKFAPPDIAVREQLLLQCADLIFTGGHALYSAKAAQHPNAHFFGCGVDVPHFEKATAAETSVPHDVAALPKPVLGYFGVIDERLDYSLIELLARAFPSASIAMVGPTVKVRQQDLPSLANIHWLGQRSYAQLPALVKGFDVCLMPFALNAATQFINPTKTLEYLAAGKPVVSTAVPDVVHGFSDLVSIATSPTDFVDRTRRLLTGPDLGRTERGLERARTASWDSIVESMRGHLLGTLERLPSDVHAPADRVLTLVKARDRGMHP